jgi:hypothetical protein
MVASDSPAGSRFMRGLSPTFVKALERLTEVPEGGWWRDVLARRDLVIAVRREALNVYYRGALIFLIERQGDTLAPVTHAKYLMRRKQGVVPLQADGTFGIDPARALWSRYAGPQTLEEMMRAASDLAGPEKLSLHALLIASPHVIDVEIALEASDGDEEAELTESPVTDQLQATDNTADVSATRTRRQDRLDVATLEEQGGGVAVVFHEAKHFTNPELRAGPTRKPPVVGQIERYRRSLKMHGASLAESYAQVCQALVDIEAMRASTGSSEAQASQLDPLIRRVADQGVSLSIDPEPRLVVFGFDQDQRDGPVWQKHKERLTGPEGFGLRLSAIGDTASKRSPAFR